MPLAALEPYSTTPAGRLAWRCRRGTKELDELLQGYLRAGYPQADPAERAAFEALLELPDPLLLGYFTGRAEPQTPPLRHVVQRILDVHP